MRIINSIGRDFRQCILTGRVIHLTIRVALLTIFGPQHSWAQDVTPSSVTLNWTAPGDDGMNGNASQYDIRFATYPIDPDNWDQATPVANIPAPQAAGHTETFTVNGLEPATDYYFAVRAADEVPNWSGISNIVMKRTLDAPLPAPNGVFPQDGGWAASTRPYLVAGNINYFGSGQVSYFFEVSMYSGFSTLAASSGAVSEEAHVTTWQVNNLLFNGITYFWRVRSYSNLAYSEWSEVRSFKVETGYINSAPAVPVSSQPINYEIVGSEPVIYGWENSYDNDGDQVYYEIEVFDSAATAILESWSGIMEGLGPSTSFTSRYQFSPGNWYRWRIRAFDGIAYSSWSGFAFFYVAGNILPEGITDLMAETGEALGELVLTWTVPPDAAAYWIAYSRDTITEANYQQAELWNNPPQPLGAGEVQIFSLTGLVPGGEYWVAMLVLDEAQNTSPLSNIARGVSGYDIGSGTEDEDNSVPTEFYLLQNYPNPFNPSTTLEYSLPARTRVTIQIFNVIGQLTATLLDEVKPAGVHTTVWNGTDNNGQAVSSGIYTYRVVAGDAFESKQMVLLK